MQRDINWWRDRFQYAVYAAPQDDDEFIEELLSIANDCGWEFVRLMEHAIVESVDFPVIVELEPHQDDKGRNHLIVNAVDYETYISLTASRIGTIAVSYIVPELNSIDNLNNLLDEICNDLSYTYAIRVPQK